MAAAAAVGGIRDVAPGGSIGLITAEPHSPYNRPPLSKGLWKGDPLDSIWSEADETVADWREPYREGVVYHMQAGRVRGVLLCNVWDQVDPARRLIAERGPFQPADLIGRLPGPD
jgi:3-phenylpropionate/trans-cinnamate dioxygenase ferredoxin reductase component